MATDLVASATTVMWVDERERSVLRVRIAGLRAMGWAWNKIADMLNEDAQPTCSGEGRWWAMSVWEFMQPDRRRRYMSGYRGVRKAS
jgi:hypothetical protein